MNTNNKVLIFSLTLAVVLLLSTCKAESRVTATVCKPLIWNISNIDVIKNDTTYKTLYEHIITKSEAFCAQRPIVVTDKKRTYAPDNHYYCSIGTYWWPDPSNPEGKYIHKDGLSNPENNEFDRTRLTALCRRCKYLSSAFYLTGDMKYYNAYLRQIRAWFIDKETFMYPNLEYGQVIPGHNNNKGRTTGTIDAYTFNDVIESFRLVNSTKHIDKETIIAIQGWFASLVSWLEDGSFGKKLAKADNNVGLAYDMTLCNMCLFVEDDKEAKDIVDGFIEKRIFRQIEDNGMQPSELKRTKAFTYSVFNLEHIMDFCFLARHWYDDFYKENCSRVDKAFEYLLTYVDDSDKFPFKEISNWDVCRRDLQIELKRRNMLMGNALPADTLSRKSIKWESLDELLK